MNLYVQPNRPKAETYIVEYKDQRYRVPGKRLPGILRIAGQERIPVYDFMGNFIQLTPVLIAWAQDA